MDGRDDDSDIFGGVGWLSRNWNRLICPVTPGVTDEAEVAMKPIAWGLAFVLVQVPTGFAACTKTKTPKCLDCGGFFMNMWSKLTYQRTNQVHCQTSKTSKTDMLTEWRYGVGCEDMFEAVILDLLVQNQSLF